MGKRIVFIAGSLDSLYKFQNVFSLIEVDVSAGPTLQMAGLFDDRLALDLVIAEMTDVVPIDQVVSVVERRKASLLLIVDEAKLGCMPALDGLSCDFVTVTAGAAECFARATRLLGYSMGVEPNVMTVDDMVINLDTYQVNVAGRPVDLTFLEYSLLAFFVRHPGRAYSREALLNQVWGIDYYGGSRTVDVHVRRIRAKLGPALATHLETVRGVGYLWSST